MFLSQLFKGLHQRIPRRVRLAPKWSINDVMATFTSAPYEPLSDAPLEALTKKTLFLVAVASARRRSCLHALSVKPGFMRFDDKGVRLIPNPEFRAKNQTQDFTPGSIFLPRIDSLSSVPEDRAWCPVRALRWYTKRTKHLRSSDQLFVLPKRPHTPAHKDTISRWIGELITPHLLPGERATAHDVRGHAASRAWYHGVPLLDIVEAGAWKTPNTFVACYLRDTVSAEGNFARAALGIRRPDAPGPPSAQRC